MSKTLTIYLAADVRKLSTGLRTGQQELTGFAGTVDRLGNTFTNMLGPAMIGAGIAAGAMAAKFAVDGVQAFIQDEAAASKLATTLDNLGLSHDTTQVEGMIDALQRETGVADDALRPAFDRLVRSIGDTEQATSTLKLAMDISAGTGRSLDSVVQALGKAYDGNTAGLSRLGAGIDKTVLATGNMDTITKDLASTFGGQAQTAASTYQGQLDRLSVGFSELQESFGSGFLSALGKTEGKTGDLMKAMENLQPALEDIGTAAGNLAIDLSAMVIASDKASKAGKNLLTNPNWADLSTVLTETAKSSGFMLSTMVMSFPVIGPYADLILKLTGAYDELAGSSNDAYLGVSRTAMAMGKGVPDVDANTAATSRWNAIAEANGKTISYTGGNLEEYFKKVDTGTNTTSRAATATDLLSLAFDLQGKKVDDLATKLKSQTSELAAANAAVNQYATTLAGQLLGGIDLSAAQQTGTDLGMSTMAAFDAQIAQANWFGNVLEEVKRQNGSQALIDYIAAQGPEAGGRFGQEAIDNGLIPEFSTKLDAVIGSANTLAQAMVPEYLRAGVDSAEQNIQGLADTFGANADKLAKIGKRIGKTIGDNSRAQILDAVAQAIAEAETSRTAAEARNKATAAASNLLSDQQVAQAFARIIQTSNSRTGYSMGVPIPSPVLG